MVLKLLVQEDLLFQVGGYKFHHHHLHLQMLVLLVVEPVLVLAFLAFRIYFNSSVPGDTQASVVTPDESITSKSASTKSVIVNARPSTTAFTGIDKICEGESATYTVTSPTGTSTYKWTYTHKNLGAQTVPNAQSLTLDFTGIKNTPTLIVLEETNIAEDQLSLDLHALNNGIYFLFVECFFIFVKIRITII